MKKVIVLSLAVLATAASTTTSNGMQMGKNAITYGVHAAANAVTDPAVRGAKTVKNLTWDLGVAVKHLSPKEAFKALMNGVGNGALTACHAAKLYLLWYGVPAFGVAKLLGLFKLANIQAGWLNPLPVVPVAGKYATDKAVVFYNWITGATAAAEASAQQVSNFKKLLTDNTSIITKAANKWFGKAPEAIKAVIAELAEKAGITIEKATELYNAAK